MEATNQGDLRIDGSGSASGGTYNSIKINGSGKITGDVICRLFRINGSGTVQGRLETDDGKISGSGNIHGDVKAKLFKINGSGQIKGNFTGETMTISGSGTVGGSLNAQQVRIDGSGKIGLDCNTEKFHSEGLFEINGLLNSDEIDIKLYHSRCKVREIGGGRINVENGSSESFSILRTIATLGHSTPLLETDLIEGDEITLENTTAKIIRGNHVRIGRGCVIDLVEYKETLEKTGDAKVTEEHKI